MEPIDKFTDIIKVFEVISIEKGLLLLCFLLVFLIFKIINKKGEK